MEPCVPGLVSGQGFIGKLINTGCTMGQKILVIGGVAAGPKAACRLKRVLADAEVTIIDQDSLISYGGCGMPYYVSGDVADEKELRSTSFHMVRDVPFFRDTKGVEVKTRTRACAVDRQKKKVRVENLDTAEQYDIEYDILLFATGSAPFILPIAGNDADGVFTVTDMHKAIAIKERLAKGLVGKAVIIGGGAIGVEMAEAFRDLWGVSTSLIEFQNQIFPGILDQPVARMMEKTLRDNGVDVFVGEGAEEILVKDGRAVGVRTARRTLEADLVVMAAGVRPRSELAAAAGLQVGARGGITVNSRMQTSDPDIYAAGDCIELPHLVTGRRMSFPLGSLANREGRVAADNIAGIFCELKGAVGSFIVKAFDLAVGSVGLTLKAALAEGFDADVSWSSPMDRAHFFPERGLLNIGLVFDRKSRRLLGLQGAGPANDALSVRIDAAAVAISNGAVIDDLGVAEMAYAPPFNSAIDPVNAAAYIADNLCADLMRQIDLAEFNAWMEAPDSHPDWQVVDVRHAVEAEPYIEKFGTLWTSMPYEQVRARYAELPADKRLVIFCNAGSRSFEIQVLLGQRGLKNTVVVPGGFNLLRRMGAAWLPVG